MMDLSIQAAQADRAKRYGKLVRRAVEQGKPIPLPAESRDVLACVEHT